MSDDEVLAEALPPYLDAEVVGDALRPVIGSVTRREIAKDTFARLPDHVLIRRSELVALRAVAEAARELLVPAKHLTKREKSWSDLHAALARLEPLK